MWALLVGGVWQIAASYYELNVSATHSIIGAIVGFSLVFKGKGAVIWAQEQIVCTGPLTGYNRDGRKSTAMMPPFQPVGATTWTYQRGKFSVQLQDIYDPTTCAVLNATTNIINTAVLSQRTGLTILDKTGKNNTLFALLGTSTWDQVNWMVQMPGNTGFATSGFGTQVYPNPSNASFFAMYGSAPWWEFQLLTASKGAKPMTCANGLTVFPNAKAPAMPGQFWYQSSSTTPGGCTTASNAALPFPPYKGVLIIVLSWFFSPTLTGIASAIIFSLCRALVLRSPHAYKRSFYVLPPMAFLTFWVNIYFVFTKGAAKVLSNDAESWTPVRASWIAAAAAGVVSFFSAVVIIPLMRYRITTIYQKNEIDEAAKVATLEAEVPELTIEEKETNEIADVEALEAKAASMSPAEKRLAKLKNYLGRARTAAMHGLEVNIHSIVEEDELVAAIHANAEVFDEKAETVFAYMQVFSAICVIFSHGAGEVGYMSGPLGAIFTIIRSGSLASSTTPPIWTVLVGAFGLVIGLGTYGYSVTRAVGTRLAKLTPSRGFAAELSTAMIIMIAAQYGLPTSSSQCITGGIIGIALCEGRSGLNLKFLFQTFMSWVWTMVFVAMITGFFFAQGAYAPSIQASRQIGYYEEALSVRANTILTSYQSMIKASGYNTATPTKDQFANYLATTISNTGSGKYYSYAQAPAGFYPGNKAPTAQTVAPWQMVGYLDTALALMQMSVKPDTTGINMCGNIGSTATNYLATSPPGTKFPWSQVGISLTSPLSASVLNATNGPCTVSQSSQPSSMSSYPLTKATFLGPSPYTAYNGQYEDKNGNVVSSFNGTVDRFFNSALPNGNVVLDQTALAAKVCQQAPCQQAWYPQSVYMG